MKRLVPQISLALVCFLLGLGLVTQFRTYHTVAKSELSPADEALVIGDLVDGNGSLRREVGELQDKLAQYGQPGSAASVGAMRTERDQLQIAVGATSVQGPGVEMAVSGYVRTDELVDLINELRNAGAEAVGVNGRRLTARSVFISGPGGYSLDGVQVTPPFRFSAIGLPATLETALLRKGGVVALLRAYYPSLTIDVVRRDLVQLPAADPVASAYALARAAS
ncbi:MAG: hypothetical protein QOF51_1454 [Chloroflexota bacterium]|jgi:uncharacterized protein YlxW (UPF0749 family)|nr:hypothetical protein [Chloroflexota bacterium]